MKKKEDNKIKDSLTKKAKNNNSIIDRVLLCKKNPPTNRSPLISRKMSNTRDFFHLIILVIKMKNLLNPKILSKELTA